ncbi:MAG TPA: hypothetical protein VMW42_01505 [Desulfatiglandales bacterium]|nr:hypothetical protein [Desulfatiglandales bacterium]
MRNTFFFLLILCLLTSCNNGNKNVTDDPAVKKVKKQAIRVAEDYAKGKLKDAKKSVDKDGIIKLTGNGIVYFIDPSRIVMGEIDEDSDKDAIVPLYVFREQTPLLTEHLVLINKEGKLTNVKVMDNVLKIIAIKERMIFAEVSKVASDAPSFGCEICREVVKYQFSGDTLSLIK